MTKTDFMWIIVGILCLFLLSFWAAVKDIQCEQRGGWYSVTTQICFDSAVVVP